MLGGGKTGRGINLCCLGCGPAQCVTGGKNHVKFWELPLAHVAGGELQSKSGIFMNSVTGRSVVSVGFLGSDTVTGMADGAVLLWKERSNTNVSPSNPSHRHQRE